ncbi:cell filamentation protein Fic [Candidatus Aerophobetes bacterium]|uniref:Cell filamentation protein Fic n=1 Tax=Aerophobetes bacterium TaxID=2030807 RepID=A0A2A4Y8Q3_UNCAE|nr:MAG: cell filamentation protein Fic [Candidatus Aerophobetes bacterium]
MVWNWQLPQWPHFTCDVSQLSHLDRKFLQGTGGEFAVLKHLDDKKKKQFIIEILCVEGLKSAEIEGEVLERESLQSSIQRHFGLGNKKVTPPKEQGMGDLVWCVYDTFADPLTHEMLHDWHRLLMRGESEISDIGKYRSHEDPMQIISGRYDKKEIFFEAPPSADVFKEMTKFIDWFNSPSQKESILAKAAVTHVYFESIHPFEDGNGRIGRALVEKVLSQYLGHPTLIAVSQVITRRKKEYYAALGACNRTLDAQNFVMFFAEIIVEAQNESLSLINFLMTKSTIMNEHQDQMNERQSKVLIRMFSEGLKGFSGGLSAENYLAITKTSRATATRDLAELVEMGVLNKTGELRHTRYWLNIDYGEI